MCVVTRTLQQANALLITEDDVVRYLPSAGCQHRFVELDESVSPSPSLKACLICGEIKPLLPIVVTNAL